MSWNSTKNRSIATNWKKNSMTGSTAGISRMELAWIVVLQILSVDGLMWTTTRWSQNDFSMVQCFHICLLREIVRELTVCALTQTTLKTLGARSWMTSWQRLMICFPLRRKSRFQLFSRNGLNAQRVRATNKRRACATRETRTQTAQGIHNSMYYTLNL